MILFYYKRKARPFGEILDKQKYRMNKFSIRNIFGIFLVLINSISGKWRFNSFIRARWTRKIDTAPFTGTSFLWNYSRHGHTCPRTTPFIDLTEVFSIGSIADKTGRNAGFSRKYGRSGRWAHRWRNFQNGQCTGTNFKLKSEFYNCTCDLLHHPLACDRQQSLKIYIKLLEEYSKHGQTKIK